MAFIRLRNLSVEFPIYQGSSQSLKKMLVAATTQGNLARDAMDRINVRALNDLTLDIEDGDRLGLIGPNGAGKTTLLRVLAGIYHPTRGEVYSSGKVSALLDISVGLNPEATGRENIILRGMYMNIHPREMRARVDEIADFTELGPYLDMPTRTYSAGMMVRLGFAVSTCVPPEILLMDEWLSAGDASFLDKAQRRMEKFVGSSSILVLASHSMELLRKWCNRGIMLRHGRIVAQGHINDVITAYTGTPPPENVGAEHNQIQTYHDIVSGSGDELARRLDIALGERNELLRQRDVAIGLTNLHADRLARQVHRSDVNVLRATIAAPRTTPPARIITPAAATRHRIMLYLYLANTGGDTLIDILIRNLETKDFLVIDQDEVSASGLGTWSHLAVEKAFGRLQPLQVDDVRVVWGPYRHGVDAHLPKPCACVTLLREPLERTISHFYNWADATTDAPGTLDACLSSRRPHCPLFIDNYMTRILSGVAALDPAQPGATTEHHPRVVDKDFERAANNLDSYMVAGLADRFDETLLLLGVDLGWSLSDLVYKPLDTTTSRPRLAEIAQPIRHEILQWNRFDAALVERAGVHLARRISSYPGDFQRDLALFRKLNALFQQGVPVQDLRRMEYEALPLG
jgi:ABC-2 type transport system ATP-binding protein/lipopolysaccharide transport system ATP-binding protein